MEQPPAFQVAVDSESENESPEDDLFPAVASQRSALVDLSHFDTVKENIQPLKHGRNAKQLAAAIQRDLDHHSKASDAEKLAERKKFEKAIKTYEGDDPLTPWLDYIVWCRQAYLQGNAKSYLMPLLEKCTRTFLGKEGYQENIRYLKVWLMYADMCSDPEEVYRFIRANRIGQTHAVFFEAWGRYLELVRGKYAEAEHVLNHGLQRGAQPRYRLEAALKALQGRALKRVQKSMAEGDSKGPAGLAPDRPVAQPQRRMGLSLRQDPTQPAQSGPSRGALRRRAPGLQRSSRMRPSSRSSSSGSTSNFQVFADEDSEEEEEAREILLSRPPPEDAASEDHPMWTNLASRETVDKENTRMAQAWDEGGGLPGVGIGNRENQGGSSDRRAETLDGLFGAPAPRRLGSRRSREEEEKESFSVYVDEEAQREEALQHQLRRAAQEDRRKSKKSGLRHASSSSSGSRAERLQAEPLRNMARPKSSASSARGGSRHPGRSGGSRQSGRRSKESSDDVRSARK